MTSPPIFHSGSNIRNIARNTLLALLPGVLFTIYHNGLGVLGNIAWVGAAFLILDYSLNRVRGKPATLATAWHALVYAIILALLLPAGAPWWLAIVAAVFACALASQAFGGRGQQLFHPAMCAYLFLYLSFPDQLTGQAFNLSINAAFLVGGLALLLLGSINWQAPLFLLLSLILCNGLTVDWANSDAMQSLLNDSNNFLMLAAFFVASDFASTAITSRGRMLFGALLGLVLYALQGIGNDAASLAAAMVLANFLAPLLDLLGRPRIYGHRRSQRLPSEEDLGL